MAEYQEYIADRSNLPNGFKDAFPETHLSSPACFVRTSNGEIKFIGGYDKTALASGKKTNVKAAWRSSNGPTNSNPARAEAEAANPLDDSKWSLRFCLVQMDKKMLVTAVCLNWLTNLNEHWNFDEDGWCLIHVTEAPVNACLSVTVAVAFLILFRLALKTENSN